ncbi:hypothetical protein CMI38_06455 [Candidatus Pacearchaeota archaeon]|nr:hypothetical protein [Candidatus Pacearchaeota archaeon]|tara:strand:+ start:2358 stop:3653 length:1296 start_codon:yes stop_codon:yes gene_type:complete
MKKEFVIISLFIISILLTLSPILAIEISLSKSSYQPEELLQAEITGNFLSLTADDIKIFKGNKLHSEPVLKDLTKQNNIYYFYAILPNQQGNFTFEIDSDYLERGEIKNNSIATDFVIEYKNTSDLSIIPGFIIPNEDFTLKVKSLYNDVDLTAKFEATGETKELRLIDSIEELIKFSLPILPPQQSSITINNYNIPIFLIKKQDPIVEITNIEFIPYSLTGTITENQEYYFTVIIKNNGQNNLTNISFTSDLNTKFIPETIPFIEANQLEVINITITVEKLDQPSLSGKITATSGDNTFNLPATFNITTNKEEVKVKDATTIQDPNQPLSCNQLGNLCQDDELCTGETTESLDGPCCLGQCSQPSTSNFSTYAGIILIILLIALIAFAIWKIKQRRKNKIKSPNQILNDRSNRYKQRMKGEEVRKSVDKV